MGSAVAASRSSTTVGELVYLVVCEPMMILAAYIGPRAPHSAHTHARTVTGGSVICVELLTELPDSIMNLINEDFEDDDTPVVDAPNRGGGN